MLTVWLMTYDYDRRNIALLGSDIVLVYSIVEVVVCSWIWSFSIVYCIATDFHLDGYTVNATKYEAVAFVNDVTMMVQGGTYLLTIEVIPSTLNITAVEEFFTTINGTGTERLDFQGNVGASNYQVILRTRNLIPPGKHSFTVELKPFSFILPGPFTALEREVELWVLPPARRFALYQCMSCYTYSIHVQWRQHVHTLYAEPCSSTLCSNGAHCSDVVIVGVETFSCNCTPGWTGPTCSEDIDFCASQPCMHGGTCIDTGDGYTCNCSGSYIGPSCADIDHCAVYTPCQNGQCVNTADTYSCICVTGWTGRNCTNDVDECLQPNTCQNGGNCSNVDGNYSCSCTPSYTGVNCEESMPCISDPCDPAPSRTASFGVPWSINRIIDISLIASICCIFLVVLIIFSVSVIVVVMICCTKS